MTSLKAFRFNATIGPDGKVQLDVPLPPVTAVEVVVLTFDADGLADLVEAATSSTGFWDNPLDDEDWNDA